MVEMGKIRFTWLKIMYLWTIISAGGFGLGLLAAPAAMQAMNGWPTQDPILLGIYGSVLLAFALVAILGLRSPLKFVPVLLLELCYKLIWYIFVLLPNVVMGRVHMYGWIFAGIFATYIIGNLIAIPFSYIFEREKR